MYFDNRAGSAPQRSVETASATTSPDNSSSGRAAYLIAAAGLLLAIALSMGTVGLFSTLLRSVSYYLDSSPYYLDDGYDYDFDLDLGDGYDLGYGVGLDGHEARHGAGARA